MESTFAPLDMKIGETWALYVCISIADMRYTLGTSVGNAFAANSELRIMEGAGAAEFPPFGGGLPEYGGVEYTFYAPRIFNGNLRYEHVKACPSQAPSGVETWTPSPTPESSPTTYVEYLFYVEHDPGESDGVVAAYVELGVKDAMDGLLRNVTNLLFRLSVDEDLVIASVVAETVSVDRIGCE